MRVFPGQRTRRKRPTAVGAAVSCEGEDLVLVLDDTARAAGAMGTGGQSRFSDYLLLQGRDHQRLGSPGARGVLWAV